MKVPVADALDYNMIVRVRAIQVDTFNLVSFSMPSSYRPRARLAGILCPIGPYQLRLGLYTLSKKVIERT